jgi:hypothetical protein
METHIIKRSHQRDLKFEGELLAEVSSEQELHHERPNDKGEWRWTELVLYRTAKGSYVLERRRMPSIDGCSEAWTFDSADLFYEHLERKHGSLGTLDKKLLEAAAKVDPKVAAVLYEEV